MWSNSRRDGRLPASHMNHDSHTGRASNHYHLPLVKAQRVIRKDARKVGIDVETRIRAAMHSDQ